MYPAGVIELIADRVGPQDNEIQGSDEMDDYLQIHAYNFE